MRSLSPLRPEFRLNAARRTAWVTLSLLSLNGCATLGSVMSPYPEKFGCKNSDHGVCIHPEQAYLDAVAGRTSQSDPNVTNDKRLLRAHGKDAPAKPDRKAPTPVTAYAGYRDSVYRELQGLIDQPVTPMLKPQHSVRTLILPYADRAHPDRLYMPRYVYSLLGNAQWVVGGYLVDPPSRASQAPLLGQVQETPDDAGPPAQAPAPASAAPAAAMESRP